MKSRKALIVNPSIQYKLLLCSILATLIPIFITFVTIYLIINEILLDAQVNNELLYSSLLFLSHKIYLILGIGFAISTICFALWTTLVGHRIIGPLYRLEKELDKFIKGERIAKISFRKHDKFVSLANKINIIIDKLQSK